LLDRRLSADAVMLCVDSDEPLQSEWLQAQVEQFKRSGQVYLLVATKIDRLAGDSNGEKRWADSDPRWLKVSVLQPELINGLLKHLAALVQGDPNQRFTQATHQTAVRCHHALHRAADTLQRASQLAVAGESDELVASELHCALDDLASIIGHVHRDDILGEIFSRFCIGK
jgi:tRNA modification GTPase